MKNWFFFQIDSAVDTENCGATSNSSYEVSPNREITPNSDSGFNDHQMKQHKQHQQILPGTLMSELESKVNNKANFVNPHVPNLMDNRRL